MSSEVGLCKYHGTKPDFLTAMGQEVMDSFFFSPQKTQNQNKTEKGKEIITEAKKPTEELVPFSC